ncbi:MAG: MFS transporter [Alphaproteobacteria bacterium]|nr:MFS transporter [Alphaproteobacteria bacterium]
MKIQRNIRLLEIYTACISLLFIIPVMLPYYRDQMNLGFKELLIGEAVFAAAIVILDVPTSWLADVWQRKYVLALGALINMIGYAFLLIGHNLAAIIAAQCLIGTGMGLISGAVTAILYDLLLSTGRTKDFRRLEGRRMGIALYSVAFSSIAGGFLYSLHHQLPIIVMIPIMALSIIIACCMTEPKRHRKIPEKHPILDVLETTKYALHGHAEVGMIIIFSAIMFSSTKLIMWMQQPYYMAMNIPESLYGVLMAVGFLLGGLSSQFAHKVDGRVTSHQALSIIWGLAVLICLGASVNLGWTGIILLMFGGTCLYGMAWPRVTEAINEKVGSERRATVLSTQSLLRSLMFIPVSFILGKMSDQYGIQGALITLVLWLFFAGACLGILALRRKRRAVDFLEHASSRLGLGGVKKW